MSQNLSQQVRFALKLTRRGLLYTYLGLIAFMGLIMSIAAVCSQYLMLLLLPGIMMIVECVSYACVLEVMLRHKAIRVFPVARSLETKVKLILTNFVCILYSLMIFLCISFTVWLVDYDFSWSRFVVLYFACYVIAMLLASMGGKNSTTAFVLVGFLFFFAMCATTQMKFIINVEVNVLFASIFSLVCIMIGNVLSYKNMCRTYRADPPQNLNLL